VAAGQELPENAGNDDVARVMREFKGRGDLGDGSPPASPTETLERLTLPDDVRVELVTGEPDITQPLHIHFDFRGRMWVTQYRQYPFPAGLKVVRYDQHLRAVFDRVPTAPPNHVEGADCVTVFEDTTGDGQYDSQRDVITGLNIATSTAVTPQGIWVLNPPYLLFYPDADRDAVVDGPPTVHLAGFGLEDTHSVANSLRVGPDGWLYAANGSTTTAAVRALLSDNPATTTKFQGQCIWRYHPTEHRFEIFAEGGGNTFGLEIDAVGLTFSGTNGGSTRGMFYPQGSYGQKTWGKHGPLTNPHAFGYFNHMRFEGDTRRFTQSLVVYQDNALPERYQDQIIAINPLQRVVISSRLEDDTSTFRTTDFEQTIGTTDRWFRPVNIAVGPDGLVYLADWYDTRLTHVDPRDNWHKSSGRIYRLRGESPPPQDTSWQDLLPSRTRFDLFALSTAEQLQLLRHPSRTLRFSCLDVLAASTDPSLDAKLLELVQTPDDSRRLLALWGLHRRGALNDETLLELLDKNEPAAEMRRWAIRLLGDRRHATAPQAAALAALAATETDPRVRSQLASSAKRLPASQALPIIDRMLRHPSDASDLHLPLLVWWALEAHCEQHSAQVTRLFADRALWREPLVIDTILARLMRRFAASDTEYGYQACTDLLRFAPDDDAKAVLMRGFEEAFAGRTVAVLPSALQSELDLFRSQRPASDLPLRLRQGDAEAVKLAVRQIADSKVAIAQRIKLIETLGETHTTAAVGELQKRLTQDRSIAIQRAALQALSRFSDPGIGQTIASAYHRSMDAGSNLREIAVRTLASRSEWAQRLIDEIDAARIPAETVPGDVVLQMQSLEQPSLQPSLVRLWGTLRETPAEKRAAIERLEQLVRGDGAIDLGHGRQLFTQHCGKCHTLFGAGGKVGPDLTGYERSNLDFLSLAVVDPSAAIREEFTNYRLLTVDGQVLTGLLENQTPETYTLRTAEGQAVQIDRDDVEQLSASPVSLMPENLLTPLSSAAVRDLFGYLMHRGG